MNGGKTWVPLFSRLTPDMVVTQIDFIDAIHGWALAQSLESGASQVITTSDGGFSWHTVATGNSAVDDIDATSASSVWLLDGGYSNFAGFGPFFADFGFSGVGQVIVQHSSDGGAHWQSSSVGSPFSVAALAASGNDVCTVGDGILTSSDAGQTWQSASSGQEYYFTGATAVSANNIWAVDASGALLHSSDGSHWVEQASPARWANTLYGVSFPDASNGWVVGASDEYGDGSVILHTSDGGASWTPQNSNLSGELVGVDFVNDLSGWAISDDNYGSGVNAPLTVEHTTDGGATWVPQYVYDNANLFAVDFVNDTTGWASGDYQPSQNSYGLPGIFTTTNAGLTWSKEKLPAGAPDMTGLQFLDANDGWAVGTAYDQDYNATQGWVLHTTDGGKTWTSLPGLADSLAETVYFSDPSDGWIGGLNGVYATTDGGVTWQQVAGGYGVTAITATDPDHVWAFGDGFLVSPLTASGNTAAPVTLVNHYHAWYDKAGDRQPLGQRHRRLCRGVDCPTQPTAAPPGRTGRASPSMRRPTTPTMARTRSSTAPPTMPETRSRPRASPSASTPSDRPAMRRANAWPTPASSAPFTSWQTMPPAMSPRPRSPSSTRTGTPCVGSSSGPATGTTGRRCRTTTCASSAALKPGTYRVEVRATDWAGNPQVLIGRNRLRVVRHGAPAFHKPGWPAGLPASSTGFFSLASHSLEAQRLLHLRASLPGAWRVPLLAQLGKLHR